MTTNESYFRKLIKGEISLSITFWIWFVFANLLLNVFFDFNISEDSFEITESDKIIDFSLHSLKIIYTIFIFIAVIRSANKYLGSKFWSFMAKVMVTINLMFSLFTLNDLARIYFMEEYIIKSEIEKLKEQLPIKVDSYTQLQNVEMVEKNIAYTYQLLNLNIQKNTMPRLRNFKKRVQESICEDENYLKLLKKDYVLNYTYLDNKGKEFLNVKTDVVSCGKSVYDLDILKQILRTQGHM